MRTFLFIFSLLISYYAEAQLNEAELLKKPLIQTKSEALKNPKEVYRMRINDYNAKQDVSFLKQFENCQALSFTAASQTEVIPLAMNKMIKLQYLDISETSIKSITLFTKKNKLLKLVYAKSGMLDDYEKKNLSKRGITLIESPVNLPVVFSNSASNVVNPATTAPSNTTTTNDTPSTNTITGNPNAAGNVNTFNGPIASSKLTKSPTGEWVCNPDNVQIDWTKRSWDVLENGKKTAYVKTEQYAILDQNGNPIALVPFMEIALDINTSFSNGMLPFQDRKTKKYGYLDNTGKIAIPAQFSKTLPFVNGMAVVEKDGLSFYIDKTGKIILSGDFRETVPFYHPKYAVVKFKGDTKHSIINNEGKILSKNMWTNEEIEFRSDLATIEVFNAGLIPCCTGTGTNAIYGYKDLFGNWAVKQQYSKASPFTAGLATVTVKGLLKIPNKSSKDLSGIINTKGEYVLPLEYLVLSDPWYNTPGGEITIAGEHKDKGFMVLNPKGDILLGPFANYGEKKGTVFSLTPFKNNYSIIEYSPRRNLKDRHFSTAYNSVCDIIDKKGKVILKEFEYIINYPVNEYGVFGFTNCLPANAYVMVLAEGKMDTSVTAKNGLARLNGEIIRIEPNSVVIPENVKFGSCDIGPHGFWSYMFGDPYLTSNPTKYINLSKAIMNKKIAEGVDRFYLGNGKEIDESFKTTGINSLRYKSELNRETIVSYTKNFQTMSREVGLYDRWQQKIIFTLPAGNRSVSFFSENRVFITQAGYVIEKLDLTKLGIGN